MSKKNQKVITFCHLLSLHLAKTFYMAKLLILLVDGPHTHRNLIECHKSACSEMLPIIVLHRPWYVFVCRSEMLLIFYSMHGVKIPTQPHHETIQPIQSQFICTSPTSKHLPVLPARSQHHHLQGQKQYGNIHNTSLIQTFTFLRSPISTNSYVNLIFRPNTKRLGTIGLGPISLRNSHIQDRKSYIS